MHGGAEVSRWAPRTVLSERFCACKCTTEGLSWPVGPFYPRGSWQAIAPNRHGNPVYKRCSVVPKCLAGPASDRFIQEALGMCTNEGIIEAFGVQEMLGGAEVSAFYPRGSGHANAPTRAYIDPSEPRMSSSHKENGPFQCESAPRTAVQSPPRAPP